MSKTRRRTELRRFEPSRTHSRNIEDREYTNDEFYHCALKIRHDDWLSAILHVRRLRIESPLANLHVYECEFCDGLHVTSGRNHKDYFNLKRSLNHLTKFMAKPGYIEKAPQEIQTRHAQIVVDLKKRISQLEAEYEKRQAKKKRVNCVQAIPPA